MVAGEGPLLEEFRREAGEREIDNIEFVGYATGERLAGLVRGAGCVVVPSISYENLPLSILVVHALRHVELAETPVITSRDAQNRTGVGGGPSGIESDKKNSHQGFCVRRLSACALSSQLWP